MIPNPGSPKAVSEGCTCCPEANHHGKGLQFSGRPGGFWIDFLCPLHGTNTFYGPSRWKAARARTPERQHVDPWAQRAQACEQRRGRG